MTLNASSSAWFAAPPLARRALAPLLATSLGLLACGGTVYVGEVDPSHTDGGTTEDAATTNTDAAGKPDAPKPEIGAIDCASIGGTCADSIDGPGSECTELPKTIAVNASGCEAPPAAPSRNCCVPKCYPSGACPKGMVPLDKSSGICDDAVECVPEPTCAAWGGECVIDDGTALTDPCTGTGRKVAIGGLEKSCPAPTGAGKALCCVAK